MGGRSVWLLKLAQTIPHSTLFFLLRDFDYFRFMLLFRYKPPAEVFVVAVAHRPGVFDKIFLVTTKNETSGELLLYSKRYRSHI